MQYEAMKSKSLHLKLTDGKVYKCCLILFPSSGVWSCIVVTQHINSTLGKLLLVSVKPHDDGSMRNFE